MQIKKAKKLQSGLTLIEMLLYMGLFSILLVTFTEIFVSILETKLSTESFSSISQESKFIHSKISKDLRKNTSVNIPSANELEVTIDGSTYRYYLNNQTLYLQDASGSYALNSDLLNITNFNVTNTNILEINLDIQSNIQKVGEDDSVSILIKHKLR